MCTLIYVSCACSFKKVKLFNKVFWFILKTRKRSAVNTVTKVTWIICHDRKSRNLLSQLNFENFKTQWILKMECVTLIKDELFYWHYSRYNFASRGWHKFWYINNIVISALAFVLKLVFLNKCFHRLMLYNLEYG